MMNAHQRTGIVGISIAALVLFLSAIALPAEGATVLKGVVLDADGRPVANARVFVYSSIEVKRSANFISAPTDQSGGYRMVVSPGTYWVIARLKRTENYGPLMAGDKHSGDPAEVEIPQDQEVARDFIVADLKDAKRLNMKDRERPVRITGRLLDDKGNTLVPGYAFANKRMTFTTVPEYVSPWADEKGRYALHLPPGKYFIGVAGSFPPGQDFFVQGEIMVSADKDDIDIIRQSAPPKTGI